MNQVLYAVKSNGKYLTYSKYTTHVGTKREIGLVEDVNKASTFGNLLEVRRYLEEPYEILQVEVSRNVKILGALDAN